MSIDDKVDDDLRGQPFIGKVVNYNDSKEEWARVCDKCFYRRGPRNPEKDCQIKMRPDQKSPKELFGVDPSQVLPEQLDGKEVGNYCPYFLPWVVEFYE